MQGCGFARHSGPNQCDAGGGSALSIYFESVYIYEKSHHTHIRGKSCKSFAWLCFRIARYS